MFGRLKPGVTLDQAQARLKHRPKAIRDEIPERAGPNGSFSVQRFGDVLVSNVRASLLVLAGAVAFVLLIACSNVANLLLARATARRREIAIRAAVGGWTMRIIRQLLTESVILSLAGACAGTGSRLARASVRCYQ